MATRASSGSFLRACVRRLVPPHLVRLADIASAPCECGGLYGLKLLARARAEEGVAARGYYMRNESSPRASQGVVRAMPDGSCALSKVFVFVSIHSLLISLCVHGHI